MLTPFQYITHNKRKSFLIIAIVIISVFTINFANSLIQSIYDTCHQVSVVPYSKFALVTPKGDTYFEKDELDDIVQRCGGKNVYNIQIETTPIRTVFGTTSTYIYFLNEEEKLVDFMKKCQLTMKEGRMPQKDAHEIVLHERIAKNKDKVVGNTLGEYTIVGLISGETEISLGSLNKNYDDTISFFENDEIATSLLIMASKEKQATVVEGLKEVSPKEITIHDYKEALYNLETEFSTISLILMLIIMMLAVSLSIAIAALTYANYSGRYDEFGILNAIGYSKGAINKMITGEILIMALSGWLIGLFLSELALVGIDAVIYSDMGQEMRLFSAKSISYTLAIPVFVFVFSLMPVSRCLRKTDLISIIERR